MLDRLTTLALLVLTPSVALASEGGACWVFYSETQQDGVDKPPGSFCKSWFGSGASKAQAVSYGLTAGGFGAALDAGAGCEAQVRTAAATGWFGESFLNECGGGYATTLVEVGADGVACLHDANSAAAALGFCEARTSLTGPVLAVLQSSMGETSVGQLGGVGGSFVGLNINLPVLQPGTGEGVYKDTDSNTGTGAACTDWFDYLIRSRAYIKVWANATVLQAACTANMDAQGAIWFALDDCPN